MYCASCGNELRGTSAFCTSCGTARPAGTAPTAAPPTEPTSWTAPPTQQLPTTQVPPVPPVPPSFGTPVPPVASPTPGQTPWVKILSVVIAVLIVGGGIGAYLLTQSNDSASAPTTTVTTSSVTTLATTTTTLDPVSAARAAKPQLYDLVNRLENILDQSARGRRAVGPLVSGGRTCSIDPYDASRQINAIVNNRQSVITQVSALPTSADGGPLVSKLQLAIQESINADRSYSDWMNYLYASYYYLFPIGCSSAPINADFADADASSARASTAKQDFVDTFNPIAESFGLRTWSPSDI